MTCPRKSEWRVILLALADTDCKLNSRHHVFLNDFIADGLFLLNSFILFMDGMRMEMSVSLDAVGCRKFIGVPRNWKSNSLVAVNYSLSSCLRTISHPAMAAVGPRSSTRLVPSPLALGAHVGSTIGRVPVGFEGLALEYPPAPVEERRWSFPPPESPPDSRTGSALKQTPESRWSLSHPARTSQPLVSEPCHKLLV
jgi:hypothetical protein